MIIPLVSKEIINDNYNDVNCRIDNFLNVIRNNIYEAKGNRVSLHQGHS